MHTRPTPTGWQHWLDVRLRHAPDPRHTDPVRALADLETGLAQPVVEIIEEHAKGSVLVRVSVFSDNPQPSPVEVAAIEGLAAEIRYSDEPETAHGPR